MVAAPAPCLCSSIHPSHTGCSRALVPCTDVRCARTALGEAAPKVRRLGIYSTGVSRNIIAEASMVLRSCCQAGDNVLPIT